MEAVAQRLFGLLAAAALSIALVGCGENRPNMYQVKGTVTYQGKPLPLGLVTFVSNSYRPTSALIESDGRYTLEAIPGENKIEVVANAYVDDGKASQPGAIRIPESRPLVPAKYNQYHSSGIVVQVEEKPVNEIDIQLK